MPASEPGDVAPPEAEIVTADPPRIQIALSNAAAEVGAVGKMRENTDQGFKFRGIEDVMNAVSPALARHGIIVAPRVEKRLTETRMTYNNRPMNVVHLRVRYRFHGPAGDYLDAVVWGEAADMADKATNKAMTAAFKYALTQTLHIPSDEPDGDEHTIEAAPASATPPPPVDVERAIEITRNETSIDRVRKMREQVPQLVDEGRLTPEEGDRLGLAVEGKLEALEAEAEKAAADAPPDPGLREDGKPQEGEPA